MKVIYDTDHAILTPCVVPGFEYQVEPYVGCEHHCHYCYALSGAETNWSREILTHEDLVERLDRALQNISPQALYLSYNTDPYQPVEATHGQTRKVLELLRNRGFSAGILTKSDLILRDVDLIGEMAGSAVLSVAFEDEAVRRRLEAKGPPTSRRIEALRQLKAAGISTGAMVAPIVPLLTDFLTLVESLATHTSFIYLIGMTVEDPGSRNWQNVRRILETAFPQRAEEIQSIIMNPAHPYWAALKAKLVGLGERRGLNIIPFF